MSIYVGLAKKRRNSLARTAPYTLRCAVSRAVRAGRAAALPEDVAIRRKLPESSRHVSVSSASTTAVTAAIAPQLPVPDSPITYSG